MGNTRFFLDHLAFILQKIGLSSPLLIILLCVFIGSNQDSVSGSEKRCVVMVSNQIWHDPPINKYATKNLKLNTMKIVYLQGVLRTSKILIL